MLRHAVVGELLGEVDELLRSGVGLGRDVGLGEVAVVVVDAVDERLALAGAPRIPADDVEPVEQLPVVGHELGEDGELAAAESGPARVDQQGADPFVGLGGAVAGEVELERRALGIGVVDRDLERADVDGVVELLPLDRLPARTDRDSAGVEPLPRLGVGRRCGAVAAARSSPWRCCSPAA